MSLNTRLSVLCFIYLLCSRSSQSASCFPVVLTSFCSGLSYLDELSVAGECAVEYLGLYQKLIKPTHWKVYLAARGVLPYIGNLITKVRPGAGPASPLVSSSLCSTA